MGSNQDDKQKLMEPQELIALARQLSERLKKHDDSATELLIRGRSLQRREEAVAELSAALTAHSGVPFLQSSRPDIVKELQQERRVLLALRQENDELLEAVQENGDAIQYVMKKYRQHSKKLCDLREQDTVCPSIIDKYLEAVVRGNVEDLEDAIHLAQEAVRRDDIAAEQRSAAVRSVVRENAALRSSLQLPSSACSSAAGRSCQSFPVARSGPEPPPAVIAEVVPSL
ncbi:hypothetical protein BV898_07411 [Hypsibius exemplaris]|uniref:FGFR1 oncogene partner 2-like protein n=1 Tax=Hypsibius exemplaris TaxID=2072580 RepID=A0A1W0WTR5_HYPEX|nr:hypothetical protein BV898_07411 [Hypsibius exemplaris]